MRSLLLTGSVIITEFAIHTHFISHPRGELLLAFEASTNIRPPVRIYYRSIQLPVRNPRLHASTTPYQLAILCGYRIS